MSSTEKQVKQLLSNAKQALNFLRTVLDDLIYNKEIFKISSQKTILASQERYKKHKAVLTNIENLLYEKQYPLSEKLSKHLANNLRKRIALIIEEAIELDRLR